MAIKSLICPIEGNSWDIERALNEVDGFSRYQKLGARQSESLRLIGEELLGMTGGLLTVENGRFWIEMEGNDYTVNLAAESIVGGSAKKILETAGHNTEYSGLGGLFKKALDSMTEMFRDAGTVGFSEEVDAALAGVEYSSEEALSWSLEKYSESVERDEKAEAWDQMELSVLRKYSKDIIIKYRNNRVEIKVIADI